MYIMPYLNLIYGLSSPSCPQQKNYIQPTLSHNRSVKIFFKIFHFVKNQEKTPDFNFDLGNILPMFPT